MKKHGGAIRLLAGFLAVALLAAVYGFVKKAGAQAETAGSKTLLDMTADRIAGLSWTMADGTSFAFTRENDRWRREGDETFQVNQAALNTLAAGVTGIGIYQTMANVDDLAQYGLAEPAVVFTVTDKDGGAVTAAVGDANEAAGSVYAYLAEDTTTVYSVLVSLKTNFDVTEESLSDDGAAAPDAGSGESGQEEE